MGKQNEYICFQEMSFKMGRYGLVLETSVGKGQIFPGQILYM